MTSQIIHFNEGDVQVRQLANSWYAREVKVNWPYGIGSTMLEAIANLNEKLKERE